MTISDLAGLESNFNKTSATWAMGDVNYDGVVSISDYIDLAAHFGQTMGGPIVVGNPVPEPGEIGMMMIAVSMLLRRRRRDCGS